MSMMRAQTGLKVNISSTLFRMGNFTRETGVHCRCQVRELQKLTKRFLNVSFDVWSKFGYTLIIILYGYELTFADVFGGGTV